MAVVYHIPEHEKVGATTNFERRMKQQGLEPKDEYIKFSGTVEECSLVEEELRKFYKYPPDATETFIETLNKKKYMSPKRRPEDCRINTTSANVGWNKKPYANSRAELLEDLQRVLETYGNFTLGTKMGEFVFTDQEQLVELSDNAQKSHKGGDFFWNHTQLKNSYEIISEKTVENGEFSEDNTIKEFELIREWAADKGIYAKGDPKTQLVKLIEEQGEFAKALLNNDQPEIIDALGDMLVVLINLSELSGYKLEYCLAEAYAVISKRTGKMIGGTFVKSESL